MELDCENIEIASISIIDKDGNGYISNINPQILGIISPFLKFVAVKDKLEKVSLEEIVKR